MKQARDTDNAPTVRLARYECRVHPSNRNVTYGTPVSVIASSVAEARERAIDLAWTGERRDARVAIDSIRDEPEVIPASEGER